MNIPYIKSFLAQKDKIINEQREMEAKKREQDEKIKEEQDRVKQHESDLQWEKEDIKILNKNFVKIKTTDGKYFYYHKDGVILFPILIDLVSLVDERYKYSFTDRELYGALHDPNVNFRKYRYIQIKIPSSSNINIELFTKDLIKFKYETLLTYLGSYLIKDIPLSGVLQDICL